MNLARTWNGERNERFGWDFGFKLSKIASLKNKHNEISKAFASFHFKYIHVNIVFNLEIYSLMFHFIKRNRSIDIRVLLCASVFFFVDEED